MKIKRHGKYFQTTFSLNSTDSIKPRSFSLEHIQIQCIFDFRYIPDPFIDTLKSEIKELTTKKQERIDEALAEKAAKGKLK